MRSNGSHTAPENVPGQSGISVRVSFMSIEDRGSVKPPVRWDGPQSQFYSIYEGASGGAVIFAHIANLHYQCPGKHPVISPVGQGSVYDEHAAKSFDYSPEP